MLTKQQRIDRHAGLGGSDAAAVLGLSPWTSPLDLYLDKRGELDEEPEQPTNWQRWGHLLEDLIADEASAQEKQGTVHGCKDTEVTAAELIRERLPTSSADGTYFATQASAQLDTAQRGLSAMLPTLSLATEMKVQSATLMKGRSSATFFWNSL